ncbi:MAG: aspartate dehydrogenase [Clostridiales bacterium]|nr:aspartate dehydrogenase [Clostridiales bacterium]
MFGIHKKLIKKEYDKENKKPVLRCSICNGEQVAGFKDIHTRKFEEVMTIRSEEDLELFKKQYGIDEITKEY